MPKCADVGAKMSKRTYVDANVLIAAFGSEETAAVRALALIDDPSRRFVTSPLLALETLPKPRYHGNADEVSFIERFLATCAEMVSVDDALIAAAQQLASRYDLSPIDALHASAAIRAGVDEFVTFEKPEKPLCRVAELTVHSLYRKHGASA